MASMVERRGIYFRKEFEYILLIYFFLLALSFCFILALLCLCDTFDDVEGNEENER